ncbi:MAG: TPM domain-containing protein [Spirochaetales bacterium]|nr:TPM domain-containing protein [Spirochaetales bacterium]
MAGLVAAPPAEDAVKKLPNPRQANGSWVLDQSGLLDRHKEQINDILSALERDTTAEVAVVVLPTIDGIVPKEFATALFNHWGIGKKGKDNGLLILHILDARRIEWETGYGLEGIIPDATSKFIQMEITVPHFKAGSLSDGHLESVRVVDHLLRNPETPRDSLLTLQQIAPGTYVDEIDESKFIHTDFRPTMAETTQSYGKWLLLVPAVGFLFMGYWLIRFLINLRRDPYVRHNKEYMGSWPLYVGGFVLLTGIPWFLGLFTYVWDGAVAFWSGLLAYIPYAVLLALQRKKWLQKLRRQARQCKSCGTEMGWLPESREDQHLEPGQIAEERIKTRDYDVWVCPSCAEVRVDGYAGALSGAGSKCEKCSYQTYQLVNSQTVRAATTSNSGLRKDHYKCIHCSHARTVEVTLPQISESSSSGSSGSSYSSSSSSSSSSSGSFGGGSSGGGGSGSSY